MYTALVHKREQRKPSGLEQRGRKREAVAGRGRDDNAFRREMIS